MQTKRIEIVFHNKTDGHGTLTLSDGSSYSCVGKKNYKYHYDSTVNVSDKENPHKSREFNCNLPFAIKLDGTRGIYIHEDVTSANGDLGFESSHGCINLAVGDAEAVYNFVTGRTRIVISYPW